MQVTIQGRNFEITSRLREYIEAKAARLNRHLGTINQVRVDLAVEDTRAAQDRQIAQFTVYSKRTILRAEERTGDMFASIDAVMDKLDRQIERYKGKRQNRIRGGGAETGVVAEEAEEEPTREIVRVKRFEVWPMHEEEAIEQMELLGHDFFIFYNAEIGSLNVVYKRKDGNYGLLQPEIP
ncbi:MAG: ribosome-associated translation inhibitor RaiA [Anaerolineae bacterium]|jgi:putative sigma-54 modulation protein